MNWTRGVGETAEFRHQALLYAGKDAFLESSVPFIREGLRADEPVLVLAGQDKIEWLHDALGDEALDVFFEDMRVVGANPARLIARWRRFASAHNGGGALRGIGEPASPDRTADAFDECRRHEALLNLAFNGSRDFWLLCPYDTEALPSSVIEGARTTHPLLIEDGAEHPSPRYAHASGTLTGDLPEPPPDAEELAFSEWNGREVRAFAEQVARDHGLRPEGIESVVFAAGELAANTVLHGGGSGTIAAWEDSGAVVLEVRDRGLVDNPLVGRLRPHIDETRGRGLWLVNQLCDLVQIRSGPQGTAIRVRTS